MAKPEGDVEPHIPELNLNKRPEPDEESQPSSRRETEGLLTLGGWFRSGNKVEPQEGVGQPEGGKMARRRSLSFDEQQFAIDKGLLASSPLSPGRENSKPASSTSSVLGGDSFSRKPRGFRAEKGKAGEAQDKLTRKRDVSGLWQLANGQITDSLKEAKGEKESGGGFAPVVRQIYKRSTGRTMSGRMRKGLFSGLGITTEGPKKAKIYDPKDNLQNLFIWHGTAVKLVFQKSDFWVLLVCHIALQIYYYGFECSYPASDKQPNRCGMEGSDPDAWPYLEISTLLILGSFLTFFVVFFNSQAYARFFQEYFIVCRIRYAVNDAFFLTRLHASNPVVVFKVLRLLHAGVYLGFTNLSQNKALRGFEEAMHERLTSLKLLTHRESARLRAMQHSDPATECLIWAMRELKDILDRKKLSVPIYRAIEASMLKIRFHFDELRAYNEQPVPFVYYHLVNIIVELYLMVTCYAATFVTPYYSIIGYLGTLIGLLGLREAAACLAEPLGLDETDIPVFAIATETHFEQLYVVTRMDTKAPGDSQDDVKDLLGLGGSENMTRIAEGVDMSKYTEEEQNYVAVGKSLQEKVKLMANKIDNLVVGSRSSSDGKDSLPSETSPRDGAPKGILAPQGPHLDFWDAMAKGSLPDLSAAKMMEVDAPAMEDLSEDDEPELLKPDQMRHDFDDGM